MLSAIFHTSEKMLYDTHIFALIQVQKFDYIEKGNVGSKTT